MKKRPWISIKKIRTAILTVGIFVLLISFTYLVITNRFKWADWTGFGEYLSPSGVHERGKTLWDWLELLIVPIILAFATLWFTKEERRREHEKSENQAKIEREISLDKSREITLQNYLEKITHLLIHDSLRNAPTDSEVRIAARIWTLTTLRMLDGERKGILLKFIREAGLINKSNPIIKLENADFSHVVAGEVDLSNVDLSRVNFRNAQFFRADFTGTILSGSYFTKANLFESGLVNVDLSDADMSYANLTGSNLDGSSFMGANLSGAKIHTAQLKRVTNLIGAILPDGKSYEIY